MKRKRTWLALVGLALMTSVTPVTAQDEEEVPAGGTPIERLSAKFPMDRANAALQIALDPGAGKGAETRLIELLTDRGEVYYPRADWKDRRYQPELESGFAIDLVGFVAARALAVLEPDPERIRKLLEDTTDAFLLDNAAYVAGMRGVTGVTERLLLHMRAVQADPTLPVEGTLEALGRLGDKAAVDPMIAFLEAELARDEGRLDRIQIGAQALGRLRDVKAIPFLVKLGKGMESKVEAYPFAAFGMLDAVVGVLAQTGDARAAPVLLEYVSSYGALVEIQAATVAGDSKKKLEAEREKVQDRHSDSLRAAIAALSPMHPEGSTAAIAPWLKLRRVRGTAARALAAIGDPAGFQPLFVAMVAQGCLPADAKPAGQTLEALKAKLDCLKDDPFDPARITRDLEVMSPSQLEIPTPSASPTSR